jgi:hypothetical protein
MEGPFIVVYTTRSKIQDQHIINSRFHRHQGLTYWEMSRILRQFPGSVANTNLLGITTDNVDSDPKSRADITHVSNVDEYNHGAQKY